MLGFANEGLMIPEQVWDKPARRRARIPFRRRDRLGHAARVVDGAVHQTRGEP